MDPTDEIFADMFVEVAEHEIYCDNNPSQKIRAGEKYLVALGHKPSARKNYRYDYAVTLLQNARKRLTHLREQLNPIGY